MTTATPAPQRSHLPVAVEFAQKRAENIQNRVADAITAFAGSMAFVYLHIVFFGVWMLVVEKSPWPTLTLVVSLEAIFLSTFVMIAQNRSAAFDDAKSEREFTQQETELRTNTQLTEEIHRLTEELHRRLLEPGAKPATDG